MEAFVYQQTLKKRNTLTVLQSIFISFYFFISFFEPYLNGIFGSITKYYILFLIFYILLANKHFAIKPFHIFFFGWLVYKFISFIWAQNSYVFEMHAFSQIGMIMLLFALTSIQLDKKTIKSIVFALWAGSFLIGFLSLFLSHPYHGTINDRQVLYLFGQECDPNNQAAFLLIGISISLYLMLCLKKHILISLITIIINGYSIFLTGSRGGFLGLISVLIFALFAIRYLSIRRKIIIFLVVLSLAFLLYFLASEYLPSNIFNRIFNLSSYEGGSERELIWANGLLLVQTDLNIVFGSGWGTYFGYNGVYQMVHNTYLSTLCDVGLIGFCLFFIPILKAFISLFKKRNYLPLIVLIAGFVPCFFIDGIGKRFFWNAIFLLFIYYVNENNGNLLKEKN